VHYVSYRFNL